MTVRIEIQNLNEVRAALKRLGDRAADVIGEATEAGADVVVDKANQRLPSGGVDKRQDRGTEWSVGPSKEKWYLRFLETGVSQFEIRPREVKALKLYPLGGIYSRSATPGGFAARPFLRPAVDENIDEISNAVGNVLKRAIGG